jgi:hypothetical protein
MDSGNHPADGDAYAEQLRKVLQGKRIEYDFLDVAIEGSAAIVFFVWTNEVFENGVRHREQKHFVLRDTVIEFPSDELMANLILLAGY